MGIKMDRSSMCSPNRETEAQLMPGFYLQVAATVAASELSLALHAGKSSELGP